MARKVAMLYDASKCMACRACQTACKQWNDLPAEETKNRGSYENPPDLSPKTWTRIKFFEHEEGDKFQWLFLKQGCMHCTDTPCVAVCPTDALKYRSDLGIVTVEQDLCNGCGYCLEFCPFDIPRIETTNTFTGEGKSFKCNLCQDRVTNGEIPACVKTCPSGALAFGERESILKKGEDRVKVLQKRFANAQLYGNDILDGLGRMYVLTEKPEVYGLPEKPEFPIMATLWQSIIQPLGGIAVGAGVLGLAVNFFVARHKIKLEELEETEGGVEEEAGEVESEE